ncbi:MAG TPA: hypothetical protein P5323_02515 [Candidatus Moranbacteria bacterium]|nr:hypothetical protein [Candidatus Moranbacteria bacterium]HRY27985.1 hypothetical protein [Candidatus Moranbacteria bacterium]HSA08199.1 hypothetical protein [Candidatus Moranbacteria bacterium]
MKECKKKIVTYFNKKREMADPFFEFGEKRVVWHELFRRAEKAGLEMYVSSGEDAYLGNYNFKNILKYQKETFIPQIGEIKADAIFDRSASDFFPEKEINNKVLNGREFKDLCWDKNLTYKLLRDFMPRSFKICNRQDLSVGLKQFDQNELVVLKPAKDLGGKGIHIDYPKSLANIELEREYILQEFVDTSAGIEGITHGRHDLRIAFVNGKIVWAHVRMPKKGSYLANVAQGGTIKEILLKDIPSYVLNTIASIQKKIDAKFDKPIYSIDLGVAGGKAYVFEINSHIGFPRVDMKNVGNFIDGIIEALIVRSRR